MEDIVRILVIYTLVPSVIGLGTYLMKALLNRLNELEKAMSSKLEEEEVRQLLADKIDPIKEGLSKVEVKLDRIMDLLLRN